MRFFQRNFLSAPPSPPLSVRETHLWYVVPDEIKSVSLLNQYMELLSPSEKQNVLSMRGDYLQKRALLARTLVRTTIARYQINSDADPKALKFTKNIHGKPQVEWQREGGLCTPQLQFNISHTSSLIACGVTMNAQIGIDVEDKQRKTKNNVLAFARRYFSHPEVEHLSAISDSEVQRKEFLKLWTLKEAYVKALGKGFSAAPFKTFTISFNKATERSSNLLGDSDSQGTEITVESLDRIKNPADNWQFALLELTGTHYAAICVGQERTREVGSIDPMRLCVRKTIPFVNDECVSGTELVMPIGGFCLGQSQFC